MEKKRIEYYPLRVLLGFLIVTEVLFFVGPLNYMIPNPFTLLLYLIVLNLCLWWGYKKGVRSFRPSNYQLKSNTIDLIIIIGLILEFLSLVSMWAQSGISVSYESLVSALLNPGEAYYSDSGEEVETSIVGILLSPIAFAALPLGICTWKKRPQYIKVVIVLIITITIVKWLGVGKRKGLLDVLLIITFCVIAYKTALIENKKLHRRLLYVILGLIVAFVFYFVFSNLSRNGQDSLAEALVASGFFNVKKFYVNYLPPVITLILLSVTSYLCQGYRALALGLSQGILPIAPLGSSWFTIAIARKLGYDPVPDTYMMLLEKKYDIGMSMNWHTIYLWLANDFTFWGVPLIVYFIGYFWAQSWCDSVHGKNVLAFPVMSLFSIMVFYFFANNQVFSFSFVPFVVLFAFYQITKKRSKNIVYTVTQ